MKPLLYFFTSLLVLFSCQKKPVLIEGFYANEFFEKRELGHDWTAVKVTQKDNRTILVQLFSRDDIKEPTCTFTSEATLTQPNIYTTTHNSIPIEFIFSSDGLSVTTETQYRKGLEQYCSGGNSIESFYKRFSNFDIVQNS